MHSPWRVSAYLNRCFAFTICFAWDFERNPLGSVSEVLYPLMYSVKMIAEVSLELLINDIFLCISDV